MIRKVGAPMVPKRKRTLDRSLDSTHKAFSSFAHLSGVQQLLSFGIPAALISLYYRYSLEIKQRQFRLI